MELIRARDLDNSVVNQNSSSAMEERPHTCGVCSASFATRECLEKHSLSHIGEGPFLCDICNKSISRQDLKRHSLLHRAEKPHVCNVCNKAFAKKSVLNKHLLWHSGFRPYACGVCNKSFANKGHLDRHWLIHSGEKPHVCNVCSKSFSRKCGLKKHALTHRERRSFVCLVCEEAFAVPEKLKEHAVIHRRKVPGKGGGKRVLYTVDQRGSSQICSYCNRVFTEPICVKLLFSHQSGIDPYACKTCLEDFVEKASKGNTPAVTGPASSVDPEKSSSVNLNNYQAVESRRGNPVPGDGDNICKDIEYDEDEREKNNKIHFDVEKKFDDFEEISDVKEEHDLDYEGVSSIDVKKERDVDCKVTGDLANVDPSIDAEEVPSRDIKNTEVKFDVIYVEVKEEPNLF